MQKEFTANTAKYFTRWVWSVFFACSLGKAQAATTQKDSISPTKTKDSIASLWKNDRKLGILLTQTAFLNWNAGGDNSFSGILSFRWDNSYKKGNFFIENLIDARYGINLREGEEPQKTDDALRIESSFGYRKNAVSKWYYSGRVSLNTQFSKGYKYPNRKNHISTFFAPGYLMVGVGADFSNADKSFRIHLSPITSKTTFVLDKKLSDAGAFGVEKGERTRMEFGVLTTIFHKMTLMKNVEMTNRVSLYSDYIRNAGKVDINWDSHVKMTINKYLESNLGLFVIFDDDIKDKESKESEIQLKQILGLGFTYRF